MKRLIITIFVIAISITRIFAQTNAEQLADKIAQRMKDSLNLTALQKDKIFSINIELQNRKMQVWKEQKSQDSLKRYLQQVENTRDSLYKTILSPDQMAMYRQKKRNLVNNNP